MTDLSPAAQAILKAAYEATRNPNWQTNFYTSYAAAALRAAADQVLPEVVNAVGDEHDDARRDQWVRIRCKFLAIADEIEAQ